MITVRDVTSILSLLSARLAVSAGRAVSGASSLVDRILAHCRDVLLCSLFRDGAKARKRDCLMSAAASFALPMVIEEADDEDDEVVAEEAEEEEVEEEEEEEREEGGDKIDEAEEKDRVRVGEEATSEGTEGDRLEASVRDSISVDPDPLVPDPDPWIPDPWPLIPDTDTEVDPFPMTPAEMLPSAETTAGEGSSN